MNILIEAKSKILGSILFSSTGGIIIEEISKGIKPYLSIIGGLIGMLIFYCLQYAIVKIKEKIGDNKTEK